jgi:hypothetical protein
MNFEIQEKLNRFNELFTRSINELNTNNLDNYLLFSSLAQGTLSEINILVNNIVLEKNKENNEKLEQSQDQ